ncbi:hypothetical protein D3C84_1239500 [compost metagenome]
MVVMVTIDTLEPNPSPNHRFIMGASAIMGTAFRAATSRRPPAPHFGQITAMVAKRNPITEPIKIPNMASPTVYLV